MFVKMKGLCYQRFLSISSDETEVYPYPKRIKIENNHTNIEKEEQQQLEQRVYGVEECMKSSNKPFYLSQGSLNFSQHIERLEKENSGRKRKTTMNEFIDFKPWIHEKLKSKLLENKQISKPWNLENEEPNIIRDDSLLNAKEHSSEAGLYKALNVFKNCKNVYELKQVQEQHSTYTEENNKKDNDNEFKLNASLPSLHADLFQVNTSGQKVGIDETWKELQLLDVPFLCGINSTFSEAENKERNNCLKELPTEENKDHYGNDSEPVEQLGNKEKNVSSHIFPTVKSFKILQTFKIPQTNFFMKGNMISFSNASNTLDSNMLSTNLKETEQKNFKNQTYVIQSENIYCSQNISVTEKQKFQNDNNIVNAANVCSEFNESNHQSVGKQKSWVLGEEEEKTSQNNFKDNLNSVKCNQMFAKKNFKGKDLGNTDGVEGQNSNIRLSVHTFIASRTPQSDECSNSANILKRTWGKVRYEDMTFNIQGTTIPLISEILRNRDLNIYYGMYCANCDKNLRKSESKLSTTKTLEIKRYLSKNILTKASCFYSTTQNLPVSRDTDNIPKWKKQTILKILFRDVSGGLRATSGTLNQVMFKYQGDDSIIGWLYLYEKLKSTEQYNISELITNSNNSSNNYNSHFNLQATIAEHQNVNMIKSNLASFSYNVNHLHPTEEKCVSVEKNPLYCGKHVQINSHINNSLKGNTESQQKYITYPSTCEEVINPKLVKNVGFPLRNKYQKIHYSSTIAEIKQAFFLHKGDLFLKQRGVLSEARCAKQYCFLSIGRKGIHDTFSVFEHEEKGDQMQLLVAHTLISPKDNSDNSFVWKTNWCSTKKFQDLTKTNLVLLNYLPSISKIKFKKLNSKCSILEMLLATVKQKKKKSKIHNIAFPKEKSKTSLSVLRKNEKHRIRRFTNSVNFANEAPILMPKCLRTSNKVHLYKKENENCTEFKRNYCSFLPKIPFFSVFDTHEKIPLSMEEMDQIPLVREVNSNNEKYIEESSVPSIKNVHNVSAKSNDICILPELSITTGNHNSELLQDNATNKDKYSKELNHQVENEKTYVHFPNAGFNSGNIFHCFSDNGLFATSPFYSGPFTDKDVRIKIEEGHCRNSLSNEPEKLCEEIDKNLQYQTLKSSRVYNNSMCFKIQREETMTFSLSEDVQTDRNFYTITSKPMSLKYNLKGLQEVGEIKSGQNYITNQNQHQTRLHGSRSTNLILSYSKDEPAVSIASGDQLTTHLSVMNNGCPEDMTDQHLLSESKNISEFELKSKFDLVLEELCMFHEISNEHENKLYTVETNIIHEENTPELNTDGISENLKNVSQTKANISFPICDTTARQNIIKNKQISLKGDILSRSGKEEKPQEFRSSSIAGEELLYSLSEGEEGSYRLQKERGNCLSHEIIRVQPLKTCSGPIRIGLSRKANPKKLHPYLK